MQQVDDPGQLVLGADGDVHGDTLVGELLAHRVQHAEEVCALTVEHVHEENTREVCFLGARPVPHCLHFDAHHGAEDEERAFDHA